MVENEDKPESGNSDEAAERTDNLNITVGILHKLKLLVETVLERLAAQGLCRPNLDALLTKSKGKSRERE